MQEDIENNVEAWEVPEIDLNMRHYNGHPSDVIKKIKADIAAYVNTPGIPQKNIEIYSAIFNALNYYKDISYVPSAEFGTGDTFLTSSLRVFNEDYEYLSSKYDPQDPTLPRVIHFSGRIKSPLSFMDKVREKITEYLSQDRDLGYFNESLRDLIGMRIVIDPPQEVKDQGVAAEEEYVYRVFYDLLDHRGIVKSPTDTDEHTYKFIPVNTRYDKTKADRIKARTGFAPDLYDQDGNLLIHIPEKRIPEMEQPQVDSVVKDYIRYPKSRGYQSMHVCIIPSFNQTIEKLPIVKGIIPPKCPTYAFEYQCRSSRQNDIAEYGFASHKSTYKPNGTYHRLQVPFYLTFDDMEMASEDLYNPDSATQINYKNKLRLRNFGESYKKFYGHSFEDYFGISFKKFRDRFTSEERNDVVAGKRRVVYDEQTDSYSLVDITPKKDVVINDSIDQDSVFICMTPGEIDQIREMIKSGSNPEEIARLFDYITASDNMYKVSSIEEDGKEGKETVTSVKQKVKSIKIMPLLRFGKAKTQEKAPESKIKDKKSTDDDANSGR